MNRRQIGALVLLLVVLGVGHLAPHTHWRDIHEFNNMTAAWLVSEGDVAYRDFFSHHPPFAYWYAAPFVRAFGNGMATYRFALLVFYVLVLAALYQANRRCSRPFSFALFVVLVTLGHVRYNGHFYLADCLFAFAVLLAFFEFWQYDERNPLRWGDWLVVGLAMFAAIGSTLVAAYPLVLVAVGLAVKYFRFEHGARRLPRAAAIAVLAAAPFLIAALYLWATDSLRAFFEQVYGASTVAYRTDAGYRTLPPSLAPLGFFIENLRWRVQFLLEAMAFRQGALECAFAWSHAGVVAVLVATHRRALALFYLAYVLLVMLRMDAFHEAPYIVHSIWAAAWLLRPFADRVAEGWRSFRRGEALAPLTIADMLRTAGATLVFVLLAREYVEAVAPRQPPGRPGKEMARLCAALTAPDEQIVVLPSAPEIYLAAGRKPAVPAFSYYAWQDRLARLRRRMVETLEQQKAPLAVIDWWSPPTGHASWRTYGEEIRDAIRRNYLPLSLDKHRIYVRNASCYALRARYERIRATTLVEVPPRELVPVAVFGSSEVEQRFALSDSVSSASLDVLLSASRRSDAWAELLFGRFGPAGRESVLARKRFRTAQVRYYPGYSSQAHWVSLPLPGGGDLAAGRYFFRVRAPGSWSPDTLQAMTAPRPRETAVGETLQGGEALVRAVCFRLAGVRSGKPSGVYPIVEQSLAREIVAAKDVRQTVRIPAATTVSAVSLLLDGDAASTPSLCALAIRRDDEVLAQETFAPPRADRAWIDVPFPPVALEAGDRLALSVRSPEPESTGPLRVWTAGNDLYAGGDFTVDGARRDNALCFKLYETVPRKSGLPDLAVSALDFEPAAPRTIEPRGPLRLTVRVDNRGTSPTGAFWLEFFGARKDLSAPPAFIADSVRIPDIAPQDAWEEEIERALYPLRDGRYVISAVADRPAEVFESNEENNRFELDGKDLLVVARKAQVNLYVGDFALRAFRLQRGRPLEIMGLVSNNGRERVGPFLIEFWAARDPEGSVGRFTVCEPIAVESLEPNAILDLLEYPRTLRADIPTGRVYIGCTVDARNEVHETREWDNTAHFGPVLIEPWH